jgi:hypothetical protein
MKEVQAMSDKLIELLKQVISVDTWYNGEFIEYEINLEETVDHLIANGVTIQGCENE